MVGCTNMTGNWMIQKMKKASRFLEVMPADRGRWSGMLDQAVPNMARRQTAVIIPPWSYVSKMLQATRFGKILRFGNVHSTFVSRSRSQPRRRAQLRRAWSR